MNYELDDLPDVGVAAIVMRDVDRNIILQSDFFTDGSLSEAALIVLGEARNALFRELL